MRVLSRGWLLVLLSVVATLLVPTGRAMAADDVVLLAEAGSSDRPMYLQPLVETPAGLVFRNTHDSTTWIDPAGAGDAEREDRLTDPVVVGDLLSSYDAETSTLRWRTIADASLQTTVLPPESTFLVRTATGYLARQGDGPYDLVAVDLLAGGTSTVIGSADQVDGAIAGPLGAAVPNPDVPGEWRYFPYDGTAPAGAPVQAPSGFSTCQLTSVHLYCWSATQLARLPLDGAPGTTLSHSPLSLVETGAGVAYMLPDQTFMPDGPPWRHVMHWRSDQPDPGFMAVLGLQKLTGPLAPVTGGTDVALAAKHGGANEAGIYRITGANAVVAVRAAETLPYRATSIAVGPGRVAWHDNGHWEGRIRGRDVSNGSDGALSVDGVTKTVTFRTGENGLSVSGSWTALETTAGDLATNAGMYVRVRATEVISSTVSGQRLLSRTKDLNGVPVWNLTTFTAVATGNTTSLPDAVSYDLWGERLVRLDADGSVWLRDLRTGAAPVQIAAALAGGVSDGVVQVAGDLVAWDLTPSDEDTTDPGVLVRDLATMAPADVVTGLSELHDLSTGYAVGHGCSDGEGCTPRAVDLADGMVVPVDTEQRLAVDGNVLGFITTDGLPAVRALPSFADAPRLLGATGAVAAVNFNHFQPELRIAASQPLTSCALELLDAEGTVLQTNPCTPAPYGAATVTFKGTGPDEHLVPTGTYDWRIVAANGDDALVDYDGSTTGLSGTVAVTGLPQPEPIAVPLPDLGFAHRLADGGTNLFRMPLSEFDFDPGVAQRVGTLAGRSGFRYDRSTVLAGDFADLTPGDDGTADHVVWHLGPDGGVRVYAVAGSDDTSPRLLHMLRRTSGWSWADSRPLVGDVNGDAWDDLVVVHRARANNPVWVLLGNGSGLSAPQRWGTVGGDFAATRYDVADADGDGNEDLLMTGPAGSSFRTTTLLTRADGTAALPSVDPTAATYPASGGWRLPYARQLAGDVTADGLVDLVTIHRSSSGGVLVWVTESCSAADGDVCWEAPVRWQTLANGWSFANSRQYLADTDGDYVSDLISVHRSGAGGMFVWRHLSDYSVLRAPERIADLPRSAGWNWSVSRESVANTWGLWAP